MKELDVVTGAHEHLVERGADELAAANDGDFGGF